MLQSLEIRNYRNLRHLTIEKLGRVNLLLGKNNTGKTSILEAVAIYINRGSADFILQLLDERGENYVKYEKYLDRSDESTREAAILKTLTSLFSNRKPLFDEKNSLMIGELDQTLFGPLLALDKRVAIRFVRYLEEFEDAPNGQPARRKRIYLEEGANEPDAILGLEIKAGKFSSPIPLRFFDRNRPLRSIGMSASSLFEERSDNLQFVKTKNIERDINGSLWDKIALTESEDEVVNALKIIEPEIDRITFRTERERERIAVVKLKSSNDVIPLRSMGDGINRILTIILAMVNCENGYLLIDEFENGLHYSVQEQLWEVIFSVADSLKIQVFATTHSYDCIDAFSAILNSGRYPKESGCMIRLDNYEGSIEATLYNADEIQATTRVHVDPR